MYYLTRERRIMKSLVLMIKVFKEKLPPNWLRLQDYIERKDSSGIDVRVYESISSKLEAHEKALRDSQQNLHGYVIRAT